MSAEVVPLRPRHAEAASEASLGPIMALTANGMNAVNAVILERMQSDIPLIPALAGHLIAGGGKRMRPMLTLGCAAALGYQGDRHYKLAAEPRVIAKGVPVEEDEEAFIAEMVRAFKTRHDYVLGALNGIRGVRCLPAQGAFYLFPDTRDAMRATGASDDVAFADLLLREAGVALVPGSAFGAPGFQRISIATSLQNLEKAMERITVFLGQA